MADVIVRIGGREHRLACRDGEEGALLHAAALVDGQVQQLLQAHGPIAESRLLLMAALNLAGRLGEGGAESLSAGRLHQLAERAESLAALLEKALADA